LQKKKKSLEHYKGKGGKFEGGENEKGVLLPSLGRERVQRKGKRFLKESRKGSSGKKKATQERREGDSRNV